MPTDQLEQQQLISIKPITVPTPATDDRSFDLQVKVTASVSGGDLPVIVFSHGNGWSMDGYEPLVDRWVAAGFVVVQPTHLDSRRNGIGLQDPRFGTIWRVRIDDLHAVLDNLDDILARAGGLDARVDRERVAVVGHSWGAQTVGTSSGPVCSMRAVSRATTSPMQRSRPVCSSQPPVPETLSPSSRPSTWRS